MRTTIDLPDDLFHQLKMVAANRRVTLKTLVHRAIESELARTHAGSRRLRFPILDSKEPRTLNLTNAEIEDLLT
jgi:predicted DNA-binding ribbon-helix-helix protein